jgi:hypothetical protein
MRICLCLRAPVITTDLFTKIQAFRVLRSQAQEGFLLIEAIGAVALCALISFLIAHYQATMLIWYHDGSQRLRAISLIQNYCEQYKAQASAPIVAVSHGLQEEPAPGYIAESWPAAQERDNNQDTNFVITQEPLPSNQPGFFPARITITWQSMLNKQEKIVVYTGVAHASSKQS